MNITNNNWTGISGKNRLKLFLSATCLLLFLLASWGLADTQPVDFTNFTEVGSTDGKYGEFRFKINWKPDMGYSLMLADKEKKNQCVIQLRKKGDAIRFHGEKDQINQGLTSTPMNPLPDKPMPELECLVKLHQHSWNIYLDNREIYRLPPPFTADSLWLQNQNVDDNAKKMRFQKTAPLYFHDDFLIADKDANQLDSWEILSGKWNIHTALEAAIEQKSSPELKNKPLEMERSPNFYSLKGFGDKGLIVSGYPFNDNYMLQAAIQMQKGESGLAFYVQDETNFYTFTIYLSDNEEAYALLQRHQAGKAPAILKAVQMKLLPDQWIMPQVQVRDNHIDAYVDKIKVMELDEALPPGGQFGLFVNSPQEMIFDDVTAESLPYLKLDGLQDVKFNTLVSEGDVFYKPGFFDWLFGKGSGKDLFPGSSRNDRWLAFGNPEDKIAVAGISVKPKSDNAAAGLLFGWKDKGSPFFRLLYNQSGSKCSLQLEKLKINGGAPEILETAELPANEKSTAVALKAELAPNGLIKLFCNDRLSMVHWEPAMPAGAAGVFVGKGSEVSVDNIIYRFKPDEVFRDKLEKNALFSNDPFMRHWASPAGEWVKDEKDPGSWHKGDFFNAFSLSVPVVENSEIHLGAKDGEPAGEVLVKVNGPDFEITESASGKSLFKKPVSELFKSDKEEKPAMAYQLSVQDTCLWGEFDNNLIFKVKLKQPLSGTRIFIRGFADANIATLHAVRDNVLDFLFTEAPYEWLKNGGTWQVINRFQCDPRWSHMNGQSADDLASFWSKYQIEGDFCIEMYAGMRHGDWYQRVGDLNLTVMNYADIPSDGYTFICSGWDPDYSQTQSRFLRNGKLVADTDKYLSPRLRDNNVRKLWDPLITHDRDVHGAWYYIKARRVGNLIEYYFDNEKIFSYQDKDPLAKGGFGMWTFMSSMMVARVKVAADKITPKDFSFAEADPATISTEKPKVTEKPVLLLNGLPANLMTSESWQPPDSAGAPIVNFSQNSFTVRNAIGGGKFAVDAKNLKYPENSISGWTCEIKRTENAGFNFHFELGRLASNGDYSTLQRYFYQISGTDYTRGIFQLVGSAGEIRPVKLQQIGANENWTRVFFPVPYVFPKFGASNDLVWRVTGFGNYQPSDIVQGLKGNGPDEAYAIKDFCPVFCQVPKVESKGPVQPDHTYQLLLDGMEVKADSLEKFNQGLKDVTRHGVISGKLSIPGKSDKSDLMWTMPGDDITWSCRWDDEKYDSIIIANDSTFRNMNNDRLIVKVEGVELSVEVLGLNKFRVYLLERMDEDFRKLIQPDILNLEISKEGKTKEMKLSWKDCKAVAPPILAKLDGITPFFQTFENTEMKARVNLDPERMKFAWDKDNENVCLAVANKFANQRLRTEFNTNLSVAQYPVFQFMYKTDPMGQISLNLRDNAYAYLDEPHMEARKVRFGTDLVKDGKWHSWTGFTTDAIGKNAYSPSIFRIPKIVFGSFYKEDQTGRNSQLFLDDVVYGPAVRQAEQLAFTPYYFDRNEGVNVFTAIVTGEKSYFELTADEKNKVKWKEIGNKTRFVPDLDKLPEGMHQILLRAVGQDAQLSQITSIPFLYDKTPKAANFAFKPTDDPTYNGSYLQIEWQDKSGAPMNLDSMATSFAGAKVDIDTQLSRIEHRPDAEIIDVNWPYILRNSIDKMKDGDSAEFLVSGLEDGAGNKTADLHVPIKINYAEDKLPPTFLRPTLPESIFFHLDHSCTCYDQLPVAMRDVRSKYMKDETCAFVRFSGANGAGALTIISRKRKNSNDIDLDSNFAMRLRFPHPEIPQNAVLNLEVKYSENKTAQVNLLDGKITDKAKLEKFLDVKSAKWQDLIVDLEELYVRKFGERADKKKIHIKEINLNAANLNPTDIYDLGFLTVFRDSEPDDKFEVDAYDQSGIDEKTWKLTDADGKDINNGVCDGKVFSLSKIEPADGVRWLEFSLKDKAGNKASPMVFPIILKKQEKK